jgi:hypothetical protein
MSPGYAEIKAALKQQKTDPGFRIVNHDMWLAAAEDYDFTGAEIDTG